jgi:ProP effector
MSNPDAAIAAVIALLAEQWPKAFSVYEGRRRPLKVGIHNDILSITPPELGKALGAYVANRVYLDRMRAGAVRIDLDGNPAGAVTHAEAEHAKARLLAPSPPATPPTPKRLSLADLKAAAQARRANHSTAA